MLRDMVFTCIKYTQSYRLMQIHEAAKRRVSGYEIMEVGRAVSLSGCRAR